MAGLSRSPVHVVGASGRTGRVLCAMLAERGVEVVPVVRNPAGCGMAGARFGDLTDPASMRVALAGARRVVSVSYAAWTRVLLEAAAPDARLVVTGTARRYSALPDAAGAAALAAERMLLATGRDAAILHPTMIYGAPADGTVRRLAALLRRYPVLPLPGGGRQLVQPVHVADLAACLVAAVDREWDTPAVVPVGGPEPLPYAALLRAVAQAAGVRRPVVVPVPTAFVRLVGRRRPGLLRLLEDRTVDVTAMRELLGVTGRPLGQGLAETFAG